MKKLEHSNYKQRIIVFTTKKKMFLYESGKMVKIINNIILGKNGCVKEKIEGDKCTPLGNFKLGFAFGLDNIRIQYPYYKISSNVYWVNDSNSVYYNDWVCVGTDTQDYTYPYMKSCSKIEWKDSEHLCEYEKTYQLGLVIEYNINPKIKKKGSAIFLHVKNKNYTEGCIAVEYNDMLYILNWLKDKNARIIII